MVKTYQIYLNGDCNLRCKYCYEHEKNRGVNSKKAIFSFVRHIIKNASVEGRSNPFDNVIIEFIGGEVFLHTKLLREIIELFITECTKHRFETLPYFNISTNGTLFDREDVRDFIETYGRYLDIGISIDGTKECHDTNRIDINGNGSWDRAVAGWKYVQNHVCKHRLSVKATFNHDTILRYAESVIALINLGFTNITANTVYEETWTAEDGAFIFDQLMVISRYIQEHGLMDKVIFNQINKNGTNFRDLPIGEKRNCNHCGSGEHMVALGFDNNIYSCHRFACASLFPIGYIDIEKDEIVYTNRGFIEEIKSQYKDYPEDCKDCGFQTLCGTCAALPYELGITAKEWFAKKAQCGFTTACGWAICHTMVNLGLTD